MEHELVIKKLRDTIYLLDEGREATGYLLIGEERACLIDTMNGYNDLSKVVKDLTDKPVVVVNTHGHPDHIYGNPYFDKAYMNEKDYELASIFIHDPYFVEILEQEGGKMPPFENIQNGDVIDLGDKKLIVYETPGHTPGGVVLLCPEERVLFTGDSINHHLWMQLEECGSIVDYIQVLENVRFLENEADYILHGHAQGFDDISLISSLIDGLKEIVAGKNEEDTPYHYFDGNAHAVYHPFKVHDGKVFDSNEHGICYRPENV